MKNLVFAENFWLESSLTLLIVFKQLKVTFSPLAGITFKVPQGNGLEPRLFVMFVNDLTQCINTGLYFLFADD